MFTVLVSQLSLLVFELFFGDEPEIIDSETFVVVLPSGHFFLVNVSLETTALEAHNLLVLFVIVVIDSVGARLSFLLCGHLLVRLSCLGSRRHL